MPSGLVWQELRYIPPRFELLASFCLHPQMLLIINFMIFQISFYRQTRFSLQTNRCTSNENVFTELQEYGNYI